MNIKNLCFPTRAHLELTSRCNFKCLTCKHGYTEYGEDLNDTICDELIANVIPNLKEIELQGTGEALLSKNFPKIFHAAALNQQCRIVLITNGALLTEELIEKIVLANMQLVVSLDGPDAFTFAQHRPVGNFMTVIRKMKRIQELRLKHGNPKFSFVVNMVVTKLNYQKIPAMIDLLSSIGIDYLFASEVRECMPNKRMWNKFRLDDIEERAKFDFLIESFAAKAKEGGLSFRFNPLLRNETIKKKICVSPWQHVFVSANGDISICCEINQSFGNIKKNSFSEIWNGELLNNFRNKMLLGEYDNRCLHCCLPWGITF